MKKIFLSALCMIAFASYAQDEKSHTLTPEQTKDLLGKLKIDTIAFLSSVSKEACMCIDSIGVNGKSQKDIISDITECIEKQALTYQLLMKTNASLFGGKDNNIVIATDNNSNEYKRFYYEIERWLKDSCAAMNNTIAINNKESEFSLSKNPAAYMEYENGLTFLNEDNYKDALPHFKRAVEIDPKFAFAWDNLGICYRRTEKYDEALHAYRKSLELDPKGTTPLHNIPVVYEMKKDYKQALEEYQKIATIYPDDPETFYGIGRIYTFYKIDYPKGLDNMCRAYNLYAEQKSPFRTDAEKLISHIYSKMKEAGKEKEFTEILEKHNIKSN